MKIKQHYYCLVDNNNKPDFRYIFTNENDAEKKRRQIKNSTTGETLFVSKHKRDFFIDGIKKSFISPEKPIDIKKGCWTSLKAKKISLLDTIKPEAYFKETIKEAQEVSIAQPSLEIRKEAFQVTEPTIQPVKNHTPTRNHTKKLSAPQSKTKKSQKQFSSTYFSSPALTNIKFSLADSTKQKKFPNFGFLNNLSIPQDYSLLKTKLFAINFAMILLVCLVTIAYTNNSSNKKISSALSEEQQRLVSNQLAKTKEVTVLGSMDEQKTPSDNLTSKEQPTDNIDTLVFDTLIEFEKVRTGQLEESIQKMVAGTPMEKMAPYIAKKDKIVAAFLVGISKKESNYGRRVPVLNGQDCFNYWGYRGIRKRMGSGGHTCFDSPEDAIETVGGRIERLVKSGVDTPEEMVLWKCGSDCGATGGWPAAHKWIKDVNMYYSKMLDTAQGDERASEKVRILNETIKS